MTSIDVVDAKGTKTGSVELPADIFDVQAIDTDNNVILIRGAVPGPKGALVLLRTAAKETVKKGGAK